MRLGAPGCALLLALAVGLGTPASAQAQDGARAQVTNTLTGEARGDNHNGVDTDDDYTVIVDRFNLSVASPGLVAQLRADLFQFVDEPADQGYRDALQIERLTLRFTRGPWEVVGGDFYRQLGRGIALSLRKNEESAVDVTLQGGQLGYQGTAHQLTAFAGRTNPANLDAISQRFVADTHDTIVGGTWDWTGNSLVKLGAFGLWMKTREQLLGEHSTTASAGATVAMPTATDWLALYAEGDAQQRQVIGVSSRGYAAYATADLTLLHGDLTFLLEGLHLQDYELRGSTNTALGKAFDYNQPPTLERIDQEVTNLRDVDGAALRAEYFFFDLDLLLFASGNLRLNDPAGPSPVQTAHAYAGATWTFQQGRSRLQASAGTRDERQDGQTLRTLIHAEADYLQALLVEYGLSIHLQLWHELRSQDAADFQRGTSLLSLEWARRGSAGFELSYDTQDPRPEVRNAFAAALLAWHLHGTFDLADLDELSLAVLAGTRRGGLRCVAGVCRDFPEFSGAQVRAILRY